MDSKVALLVEIRDAAVNGEMPLTTLLRKCQVLASQLDNADLKRWTSRELNGYPDEKSVPKYRKIKVQSVGNFAGSFGRTLSRAPIPLLNLKPKEREVLGHSVFLDGVGTIEGLLTKENKNGQLTEPWSPDVTAVLAGKFYQDFNLLQAYKIIPRATVSGLLEVVRNRILEFALQLLELLPEGESIPSKDLQSKTSVQKIFNTYILGDGNRVAADCDKVDQSLIVEMAKGNWDMLAASLSQIGVSKKDQLALKDALDEEPPQSKSKMGGRVSAWFGRVVTQIGAGSAAGVIARAVCNYCGF